MEPGKKEEIRSEKQETSDMREFYSRPYWLSSEVQLLNSKVISTISVISFLNYHLQILPIP